MFKYNGILLTSVYVTASIWNKLTGLASKTSRWIVITGKEQAMLSYGCGNPNIKDARLRNKTCFYYYNNGASPEVIVSGRRIESYCPELVHEIPNFESWKQYRVFLNGFGKENRVETKMCGKFATNYINKLLEKYGYDEAARNEALQAHELESDAYEKQCHRGVPKREGVVERWNNCVYYDINGAHADALCEIFPNAREAIVELKEKGYHGDTTKGKQMINYYVGNLVNWDHRKTYQWIVDRTSKKLYERINEITNDDSIVIYANTDGVVVYNPSKVIPSSKALGEFKLENSQEMTVYTYNGANYTCYEYWSDKHQCWEIKGSLFESLRDKMSLRDGKVVSYKRVKSDPDNKYSAVVPADVQYIHVEVEEYGKE